MLFRISLLLAVTFYGSCMEMRETVERMVMVRTTGSDLQPEATGYIYKKKNGGEESVIEMGESEVMEHLAKYYKEPKSFNEPSHVAAEVKEGEENKDASKNADRVIPVSEESQEKIDGLASDDFKKILEKYGVNFDHEKYDHYSHDLGDFDDGYYHGYGDDNKENKNGYKNHPYGNGGAGDYHNRKYEGYTNSHKEGDGNEKKDSDAHKEHDERKLDKQNESETGKNKRGHVRFQKTYDNDQKDRKYYGNDDGVKFEFYKYRGGNKYHGDDKAYRYGSHETGDNDSKIAKTNKESGLHGPNTSAEEKDNSSDEKQRHYGSEGGQIYGNSFSFKIKH